MKNVSQLQARVPSRSLLDRTSSVPREPLPQADETLVDEDMHHLRAKLDASIADRGRDEDAIDRGSIGATVEPVFDQLPT